VCCGDELVGGIDPGERRAAFVVGVDEDADRAGEVGHAREGASADGLTGDDPKKTSTMFIQDAPGRGEVQGDPGMLGQAGFHAGWLWVA